MESFDPFTSPEWNALHREASLVSQVVGAGVTSLGRASYGSGFGEYYTAFFGLSVGVERLAKLIIIADLAIRNGGQLPTQSAVRSYGHKLKSLIVKVNSIASENGIEVPFMKPDQPICAAIIECLDAFADASQGRYANFEAIGNPAFDIGMEPVNKWWVEVVEPILDRHYRGRRVELKVKERAALIDAMIGAMTLVRHTDERGRLMSDVASASERTGQTQLAQKYGRFYALCIVRWLSHIFSKLAREAAYTKNIDCLFGHDEFFATYCNENEFLLTRKIWPLR